MAYTFEPQGAVNNEYIKDFLLGGKCDCIIENTHTGNKFYFSIKEANKTNKDDKGGLFFVYSITGLGSIYAGCLRLTPEGEISYSQGAKGKVEESDKRIQALLYVLNKSSALPPYVLVQHNGKCSRCHRALTDPESIRRGMGPECAKKGRF